MKEKKYDNPYIFADNLAGFKVFFVADPTCGRGQAKMLMHPEDYKEMKDRMQTQTAR